MGLQIERGLWLLSTKDCSSATRTAFAVLLSPAVDPENWSTGQELNLRRRAPQMPRKAIGGPTPPRAWWLPALFR